MFQFFRRKDKAVRFLLGGLLVMVCVMMVVTLIPGLTGSDPSSDEMTLATVGSEAITSMEVSRQVSLMQRNSRMPPSMLSLYTPMILNQMVMDRVTQFEAERMGLRVSHDELIQQLRQNPTLFPGGQFIGNEQYSNFVQTRFGLSVPQFEERYRQALQAEKLRRLVTSGVTLSDEEIAQEFHRRNDKLTIEYALLKTSDIRDQLKLGDADVVAFFEANRGRYQRQQHRQFRLLYVDTGKLRESVAVSDEDLQRYYSENRGRFRVEDRVHVSHILFKTVDKTPEQVEETRKKAEGVLQRLQKGEDFAKLARENSDDAANSGKGGDLGWIVRNQTVPEFEKTAFTMEPGSLSGLIKTQYGFHIIKLHERQRAHQQTLDEVRNDVVNQVRLEKASRAAEEIASKAEAALRRNPNNLQAISEQLGVPVVETGLVKRGDAIPPVGSQPALDEALFAENLRVAEVSPVITVPNGLVIATVTKIEPARPAELAEVRDQVLNDLRNERAAQEVSKRIQQVADQAKSSGDLKKPAAAASAKTGTSEPFTSTGSIKDVGAASSLGDGAFAMEAGQIGGPVAVTDGQLVFRVVKREPASDAELAASRDALRNELLEQKRSTTFQVFLDSLKERLEREGKLKVNEAALKRLTSQSVE